MDILSDMTMKARIGSGDDFGSERGRHRPKISFA